MMPAPDGYQLLELIRKNERTQEVPVVVLTALDSDAEVARAFEAGADDFVRKPFRPVELIARIRGQLRLRGYIDALAQKERDAKVVLELTQALASSLDLQEILFTVVQRIAEVAHVDRCSIVLVREASDIGYVAATSDNHELHDLKIDLERYPEIRQVMHSGLPLVIENAAIHALLDGVRDDIPQDSVGAMAILPLGYEERPMGVLFLRARQSMKIGLHELSIARTVANATAIALRNATVVKRLRDKTERVSFARLKAERRLQLLKRYADFFESAADGILVADTDGQILFSNARARELTGLSHETLRGMLLDDLVTSEHRSMMRELRTAIETSSSPKSTDMQARRSDGAELLLSVACSRMLQDDNAILLSLRDVTRERRVELELKKTKESLERVIDSSANAIVSIDRDGTVRLFNRAAERSTGLRAEEVIGKLSSRDLFGPLADDEIAELLLNPSQSRMSRVEEHRMHVVSAWKEQIPVSLSAALIFEGGAALGAVVVYTDLRDKLRMEARLAAAQEELEAREKQAIVAELAGAAAHELNQPLTSVMGYAELLKRKLERDSAAFAASEVIISEAERMAEIVRKIGKITRYETKSYVGAAKILDLDRASDEAPYSYRR
jgi:PAS domain S-box-containing protein